MQVPNLQASGWLWEWLGLEASKDMTPAETPFAHLLVSVEDEPIAKTFQPQAENNPPIPPDLLAGMGIPVLWVGLPQGSAVPPFLLEASARAPQTRRNPNVPTLLPELSRLQEGKVRPQNEPESEASRSALPEALLQQMEPTSGDETIWLMPKPNEPLARDASEPIPTSVIPKPVPQETLLPGSPTLTDSSLSASVMAGDSERSPMRTSHTRSANMARQKELSGEPSLSAPTALGSHPSLHRVPSSGEFAFAQSVPEAARWTTIEQVAQQIEHITQRPKEQSITLQIDPPDWGRLEIRIQVEGSKVHTWLLTEHDFVRRALEQSAQSLREQLAQRGLQLGAFNVGTGGSHTPSHPTPSPFQTIRPIREPHTHTRHATESLHLLGRWSAWA